MKVNFFATCLGAAIYSSASLNAIKLLRKENLEVVFKKDQTCCGQPSYNSGYYEETKKLFYTISNFIPITTTLLFCLAVHAQG